MTALCECCMVRITEDEAQRAEKLCPDCRKAWRAIPQLSTTYKLHVLAAACCTDKAEICRRIGCTPTAHQSGVGNATLRTGIGRARLVSVAKWAVRTGRIERPEGFEGSDCRAPEPPAAIVHCAIEGVEVDEQTFDRAVQDALAHPDVTSPPTPDAFVEAVNRLLQAKRDLDQRLLALQPAQQKYQQAVEALARYGQVA